VWWRLGAPLLILAVGVAAYTSSFAGQFLIDDFPCIPNNPNLRTLWPLSTMLRVPSELPLAGRPIPTLTFALNYAAGGVAVWGYHLVNLLLHLATALTLFGLIRRTLAASSPRLRDAASASWLALSTVLIWTVHPLLTSSVTYLIQRTELIMSLCLVLTLYAARRSVESAHRARWEAVAITACAVGMASKEVMVVAPVLVALSDRLFLVRSWRVIWSQRRRLYLGLAATWVVLAMLVAGNPRPQTAGFGVAGVTSWDYLRTQSGVVWHYVRLAIWPHPLVIDYADWPLARSWESWLVPGLALAGLVVLTVTAYRRESKWACVGAWFFLILAPSSSVVPVATELVAEHRMYLPLVSLVLVGVVGGWRTLSQLVPALATRRAIATLAVVAAVSLLGTSTWARNVDYHDEVRMLRDCLAKRPANARAQYNLGIALAERGRQEEAKAAFRRTLKLKPTWAAAHNNLGVLLEQEGQLQEAIASYQAALRLDPAGIIPANNLRAALAKPQGAQAHSASESAR